MRRNTLTQVNSGTSAVDRYKASTVVHYDTINTCPSKKRPHERHYRDPDSTDRSKHIRVPLELPQEAIAKTKFMHIRLSEDEGDWAIA